MCMIFIVGLTQREDFWLCRRRTLIACPEHYASLASFSFPVHGHHFFIFLFQYLISMIQAGSPGSPLHNHLCADLILLFRRLKKPDQQSISFCHGHTALLSFCSVLGKCYKLSSFFLFKVTTLSSVEILCISLFYSFSSSFLFDQRMLRKATL